MATTTETNFDDYVVGAVERFILPMLNVGVMYFSIKYLNLTEEASKILRNAFVIAFTFYAIRLTTSSLRILLESYARGQEGGEEKVKQLRGIMIVVNILIWSWAQFFFLTTWATM